jgi:hypothetical protein
VALATVALAVTALVACRQERAAPAAKRGDDLQTVDVAPPPDARVDVERDVKERRRAETFSGVLPGGFPATLPLPPRASLVDQGRRSGGAWVELLVPQRPAAVREPYLRQLRAAGWEVVAGGAESWRCRRGASAATVSIRAQGPSTRIRLEY